MAPLTLYDLNFEQGWCLRAIVQMFEGLSFTDGFIKLLRDYVKDFRNGIFPVHIHLFLSGLKCFCGLQSRGMDSISGVEKQKTSNHVSAKVQGRIL